MKYMVKKISTLIMSVAMILLCFDVPCVYSRGGGGGGHGGGHGGGFHGGGYHGGGRAYGGYHGGYRGGRGARRGAYGRSGRRGGRGGRGYAGRGGWGRGPGGWNRGFRGGWGWGWAWGWYGGLWLWAGWPLWWWQLYYPSYYDNYVQPMHIEINNQYPDGLSDEDSDDSDTGENLEDIDPNRVKILNPSRVPGLQRVHNDYTSGNKRTE